MTRAKGMNASRARWIGILCLLLPLAALAKAPRGEDFEQPHEIPLAEALPEAARSGPGWVVADPAFTDGFGAHFELRTDKFGEFVVASEFLLGIRVRELHALDQLAEVRKGEAYTEGPGRGRGRARLPGEGPPHAARRDGDRRPEGHLEGGAQGRDLARGRSAQAGQDREQRHARRHRLLTAQARAGWRARRRSRPLEPSAPTTSSTGSPGRASPVGSASRSRSAPRHPAAAVAVDRAPGSRRTERARGEHERE